MRADDDKIMNKEQGTRNAEAGPVIIQNSLFPARYQYESKI